MTSARISIVVMMLAGCGGGNAQSSAAAPGAGSFGFGEAIDAAIARHPGALAFEVEYESHGGREVVEVELFDGSDARELFFEPGSGAFIEEDAETPENDEEAEATPALRAQLATGGPDLRGGVRLAFEHYQAAQVREVELEMHEGRLVYEVSVRGASGDVEYVHDAATGELLGHEDEETQTIAPAG